MDERVEFVVGRFNAMLAGDGASISVVRADDVLLELRYSTADGDAACEACVLDPDDLEALIGEALAARGAPVSRVRVVR